MIGGLTGWIDEGFALATAEAAAAGAARPKSPGNAGWRRRDGNGR